MSGRKRSLEQRPGAPGGTERTQGPRATRALQDRKRSDVPASAKPHVSPLTLIPLHRVLWDDVNRQLYQEVDMTCCGDRPKPPARLVTMTQVLSSGITVVVQCAEGAEPVVTFDHHRELAMLSLPPAAWTQALRVMKRMVTRCTEELES